MSVLLRIESISKSYPGVKALQDVSFEVQAGTVHAVMGENGAGKSTLMQIIAGAHPPDQDGGKLIFEGEELHLAGVRDANHKGIAIVFQELNLAPNMSIAENVLLGMEPRAAGVFVNRAAMLAKTRAVLDRLGIGLDPDTIVRDLTIAQQQMVEIAKSLVHDPRLLILDEPTSSLSESETLILFRVIADLRAAGVTMLYISHRMREVFAICDDVTILRDGRHVRTMALSDTSEDELVRLMVGRDLANVERVPPRSEGEPIVLSVRKPDPRTPVPGRVVRPAARRDRGLGRTCRRRPLGDGAGRVRRPAARQRRDPARRQAQSRSTGPAPPCARALVSSPKTVSIWA